MDSRGWGWTASEIRQARLTEWIVHRSLERPAGQYVPIAPFYETLPRQDSDIFQIAWNDLQALHHRSLIRPPTGMGGIEALDVLPTSRGRQLCRRLAGQTRQQAATQSREP